MNASLDLRFTESEKLFEIRLTDETLSLYQKLSLDSEQRFVHLSRHQMRKLYELLSLWKEEQI